MFREKCIHDFDEPALAPFRNMKAQFGHLDEGIFVAEGEKVVRRLLESKHPVVSVLIPPSWRTEFELLLLQRKETVDLFIADKAILEKLTGFQIYQGVLAVGLVPAAVTTTAWTQMKSPRLLFAIDGLTNAENVGGVVRSGAAFGAQGLIVGETSAHPYLRRSVRASMGTVFDLPFQLAERLSDTLRALAQLGVQCVAAHPRPGSRHYGEIDWRQDTCLVLGAEGNGIRDEVAAACTEAVQIPMAPGVDSLNVASATAVILAEAQRQRNGMHG
jgi:tRNA G18 (ribose-2'-O)-methylase SpoU